MADARDYQQACHDSVLAAWGEEPWYKDGGDVYRSVVVNLTTSAGKTFIAGLIIQSVRDRGNCLFLADTDELCSQPVKNFYRMFKMHASVEKAGERASNLSDLVIGSAQTLARKERLQRYDPAHFGYIFVDEAHRGSPRNKEIYDYFPEAKVMGMTATAFRAKLKDLSDFYDTVAFEMGMFDLIDEGYVSPLKVLTLPVKVDISAVHQTMSTDGMDYDKAELDTTIRPYYEEICRLVLQHAADRRIVAFLPLIKSSQEFVQIAQDMGIKAMHVDGKSPDRSLLLSRFEAGEFQLLSNSSLLTTGWDCPPCDCLLNLAPTRSAGLFQQKVGRIGRVLAGVIDGLAVKDARKAAIAASAKPDALILDLLWQTERFGLMGPADLVAGNEEEKKALQLKLAGLKGANDLQRVAHDLQEEREEALKRKLIAAAKRRPFVTSGELVDVALVAATLHAKKVVNYEPIMKWQRKEVTKKQAELLAKFKVDPETVKDQGHASAMLDVLLGRLRKGMASFLVVEALEKRAIADPAGFTDWQAYEILGGNYPMPFSKKYGQPFRQIPGSFWRWCGTQDWIEKKFPIVWNWMTSVLDPDAPSLQEARCQCIGSHQAPNCPVHPRVSTAEFEPTGREVLDLFDVL